MKSAFTCFILWAVYSTFVNSAVVLAQSDNIKATDGYQQIANQISDFIQTEIEQKNIPALSIAIVDGDEIVWAEGFGSADPDSDVPATARTIYRVGSVSKLLNDVAVIGLVEQGKLTLDDDIRKFVPEFEPENPFDRPITLRQLMNHQSGLVRESPVGNYFDPTEPTLRETVLSLNQTRLVHAPNTRTKYSNVAVSVAGYAIEKVTGDSFSSHLKKTLLDPLGMSDSSYIANETIHARLAKAKMWSYDGRRFDAPDFQLGTLPAGNLYSTVVDLGHFMKAVFNNGTVGENQVIDQELLTDMLAPQTSPDGQKRKYGIGFRIGEFEGHSTFEHGGAVYGFATQFRGLKEQRLGVIVVASLDVANGFVNRVANGALKMALAKKAGEPIPRLRSTEPVDKVFARQVSGLYKNGSQTRRLLESGGRLILSGGTYDVEVRKLGEQFVVDDVLSFGTKIELEKGRFKSEGQTWIRVSDTIPQEAPDNLKEFIGEYGWPHNKLFVYERDGQLWTLIEWVFHYPLSAVSQDVWAFPDYGLYHEEQLIFKRNQSGEISHVVAAEVSFERLKAGPDAGETFKIQPLLPPERLREIALAAKPRKEPRDFLKPDLVELADLDSTLSLDIRYATENNFMGTVFYKEPRAFLQRPAAEALVRAHRKLNPQGYGLLVHDAYRPWFVTKMFWDATPREMKHFVANPDNGSRHNRGCAVDLTLYDLKSGKAVDMIAGYDEFSERAYPDYPGGTSRQRWLRRLLKTTMETQGFEIYEYEWWHFDYKLWQQYPVLNKQFSELGK